ncbi:MAG: hypothetical protein JJ911_07640 [Rhizobiaceae bacterium]|nr:hypothetical protein [Rhizobiaceae bacterium]
MDWNAAIERHRTALKRVLVTLAALAGLGDRQLAIGCRQSERAQADGSILDCLLPTADCLTLPRHLHRAVLRLLRPAEAAVRRLIIVAARDVEIPPVSSPHRVRVGEVARAARRSGGKQIALPLTDPLRRSPDRRCLQASRNMPRISIPGWSAPAPLPVPPSPDDEIDATRLALRLAALTRVLNDLPREARRFARWRALGESPSPLRGSESRQATRPERGGSGTRRIWPLRLGRPPGQRLPTSRRPAHTIHQLLDDIHGLAFWALEAPDTS